MYIRNIYHGKLIYFKTDLIFLLPFVVYVIYYSDFYLLPIEHKIFEYNTFLQAGIAMSENLLEWIFEILTSFPFIVSAIILLKKIEIKVKNEYSDIVNFNYKIARKLLFGVLLV